MDSNPDFVTKLVSAIGQGGPFPQSAGRFAGDEAALIGATCLILSAEHALAQGDPQTAWDFYRNSLEYARHVHNDGRFSISYATVSLQIEKAVYERLALWAIAPQNTQRAVAAAAVYVEEYRRHRPAPTHAIIAEYRDLQPTLKNPPVSLGRRGYERELVATCLELPWEKIRVQRHVDLEFAKLYDRITNASSEVRTAPVFQSVESMGWLVNAIRDLESYPDTVRHHEQLRRGTVYQLALIAYAQEHGAYPSELASVRVGKYRLPNDTYDPNHLLVYGPDIQHDPYLGNERILKTWLSFADGEGAQRRFVLPLPIEWDLARFARRVSEASTRRQVDARSEVMEPETDLEQSGVFFDAEPFTDLFETDELSRLVVRLRPNEAKAALLTILKDALASADAADVNTILGQFWDLPWGEASLREQLLPILINLLDQGDLPARIIATKVLETWIGENPKIVGELGIGDRVSRAASVARGWDNMQLKVPIHDVASGNYYEALRLSVPDELLPSAAKIRQFRGIRGQLPTTALDPDFVRTAFPNVESYLTSESDDGEVAADLLIEYVVD